MICCICVVREQTVGARTTLNDFVPGFPEGVQKGLARSQGEGPPG